MITKEQTVWYRVRAKWCRGKFCGSKVVPNGEPTREFTANIKATNRSTLGQVQYLLAIEICKAENINPVYVCDMKVLDKTVEYSSNYKQISVFERSAY
jgi:hypothetical protein